MNDKRIVDQSGTPYGPEPKEPSNRELIEALVEARLTAAVADLRKENQGEFVDIEKKINKKNRVWHSVYIFIAFALGINLYTLYNKIPKYVQEQFIEPKVTQSVNQIIEEKSENYVDSKIKPLESQVSNALLSFEKGTADIAKHQKELEANQLVISEQVRVQQLSIAAKSGDLKAWKDILELSQGTGDLANAAKAAQREVEIYYDTDRGQLLYQVVVDTKTMADPGFSIDELTMYFIDSPESLREAIVNSICNMAQNDDKQKAAVISFLCDALPHQNNLRVCSRITRALYILTKQEFRPLEFEKVSIWWNANKEKMGGKSLYLTAIAGYRSKDENVEKASKYLNDALSLNDKLDYTRYLKCTLLLAQGKIDEAEVEYKKLEINNPDYRWLHFGRAELFVAKHDNDKAIESINRAIVRDSSMAEKIKHDKNFESLLADPRIKWPENSKKD